jgi:hypothetical protein
MSDKRLARDKEVSRCRRECPYYGTDGCFPSPVMECNHPEAPEDILLTNPRCAEGFPDKCPLPLPQVMRGQE